jgi:hypothetical protein
MEICIKTKKAEKGLYKVKVNKTVYLLKNSETKLWPGKGLLIRATEENSTR